MHARLILFAAALLAPTAASAVTQMVTVNFPTIACQKVSTLQRGLQLHEDGDSVAVEKLINPLLQSGECRRVDKGERVYLEQETLAPMFSCVRFRGEPECVAIPYEAIRYQ